MKKTTKLEKLALTKLTIGRLTNEKLQEIRGAAKPSQLGCPWTEAQTCSCFNC